MVFVRWALLFAAIVVFNLVAARGLTEFAGSRIEAGWSAGSLIKLGMLAAYSVFLAIPFVPGAEIGISLLIMQGATIAPFVHASTVAGLCLAYGLGHAFSTRLPCAFLGSIGLQRACVFVEEMKTKDTEERLQALKNAAPRWVGRWVLNYRYLLIAVLINLPGNSLIGGGGGILLVAGMSGLFRFPALALVVALATAPIPWSVWYFGGAFLQ